MKTSRRKFIKGAAGLAGAAGYAAAGHRLRARAAGNALEIQRRGTDAAGGFRTRGVVLIPDDFSLTDWPERAAKQLPWNREVSVSDLRTYAARGIRNATSFAVWIDAEYVKAFGDPGFIGDYGQGFSRAGA